MKPRVTLRNSPLTVAFENGADAGFMGITCYTVRPTARCMYWH